MQNALEIMTFVFDLSRSVKVCQWDKHFFSEIKKKTLLNKQLYTKTGCFLEIGQVFLVLSAKIYAPLADNLTQLLKYNYFKVCF